MRVNEERRKLQRVDTVAACNEEQLSGYEGMVRLGLASGLGLGVRVSVRVRVRVRVRGRGRVRVRVGVRVRD